MTPIVVELTDHEQRIAKWIARERQASNERAGVVDRKVTPNYSALGIHEIGFGGELAFCKLFNLYPDFEIGPRRGSVDCERFGETIDVKTRAGGDLLVLPRKATLAANVYALMIVDWPRFQFVGFARGEDIFRTPLVDLGYGPTHAIPQGDLTADHIRWGSR